MLCRSPLLLLGCGWKAAWSRAAVLATAGAPSDGSTSPGRPKASARLLSAWHALRSRALILFGNFHTCSLTLISRVLASTQGCVSH